MTGAEILEVGRDAILTLLAVSTPIVGAALVVGLVIAVFQSATQINEMTLTFVPKVVTIFLVLMFSMSYIGRQMSDFMQRIADRIVAG